MPSNPCFNSCTAMQGVCRPTFASLGIELPEWYALTLNALIQRSSAILRLCSDTRTHTHARTCTHMHTRTETRHTEKQYAHTLCSPPPEFIYDFSAELGGNFTANCTAFGSADAAPDIICPSSYAIFGKDSTSHYTYTGASSMEGE